MYVSNFVPKMFRELLIHIREEQMPSTPQYTLKETQGEETHILLKIIFYWKDALVHMTEMNEYHKYISLS